MSAADIQQGKTVGQADFSIEQSAHEIEKKNLALPLPLTFDRTPL